MNRLITRGLFNNSTIITNGFSYYSVDIIIYTDSFLLNSSILFNNIPCSINTKPFNLNGYLNNNFEIIIHDLIINVDSLNFKSYLSSYYPIYDKYFSKNYFIGKLIVIDKHNLLIKHVFDDNTLNFVSDFDLKIRNFLNNPNFKFSEIKDKILIKLSENPHLFNKDDDKSYILIYVKE